MHLCRRWISVTQIRKPQAPSMAPKRILQVICLFSEIIVRYCAGNLDKFVLQKKEIHLMPMEKNVLGEVTEDLRKSHEMGVQRTDWHWDALVFSPCISLLRCSKLSLNPCCTVLHHLNLRFPHLYTGWFQDRSQKKSATWLVHSILRVVSQSCFRIFIQLYTSI